MNSECNCKATRNENPHLLTVNASELMHMSALSTQRLMAASGPAKMAVAGKSPDQAQASGLQTYFHLTPEGDSLATTSFVDGSTGDIVVRGTIFGFPYELHLRVALQGQQIEVTLHLTKPIEIGPYTWRFDLGGVQKDAVGNVIGATTITPAADFKPMGLDWWCAVKCGGATILPTLVVCLPALAGGPAGYIACVTAKLGAGDAAAIATCIAKKCI
jgi:hypothetical protein